MSLQPRTLCPGPQVSPRLRGTGGRPRVGAGAGAYMGSLPAGTPSQPPSGPDSPPLLPTAWATVKHREDLEVRGCYRGAGDVGGQGCHVGPDSSLPSQRSSCHGLPPTPKVHVSVRPTALQPRRPLPTVPVLPDRPLASPRWVPASPRSSMAAPCGSTLLSHGFTLSPGVGQG